MNQREKIIVGIAATVVVLFFGQLFYKSYASTQAKLQAEIAKANRDLQQADLKLKVARSNEAKLKIWQEQSLPHGNQTRAYQLYYNWLYDTLATSSLKPEQADRLTTPALPAQVGTIGVNVTTKGSLTNLVDFLYKFYSSPQLHQITRMELTPEPGGRSLKTIKLQVEALVVPNAVTASVPPKGTLNPFKLTGVGNYRDSIGQRNIFKPLQPSGYYPPPPPPPRDIPDLRFVKFTGTTLGPTGLIAWIIRLNTGDQLLVTEGQSISIGAWSANVVAVENRYLTLEQGGLFKKVDIGERLIDGKLLAMP